ncbi:glycoside hydrolase family 15 protein [Actinomadura chokoriensis]|uniref:glycoside hydrolase family 15 protein n=1 Tax=Actinomadura chokoriensis TaxID=454156 RepID=UPI0031F7F57D
MLSGLSTRSQMSGYPPIQQIAGISNGQGELALLDHTGNVTSFNFPEADGAPVCAGLFGGPTLFRFALSDKEYPVDRRQKPTSHTVESTWVCPTGKALEWAAMVGAPLTSSGRRPQPDDGGRLVRLLTCEEGTVRARLDLCLRYGHQGEQPIRWTLVQEQPGFWEYKADVAGRVLLLSTNMVVELDDDGISMQGELTLKAGESAFVCIGWKGHASPTTVEDVQGLLAKSEKGWLKWVQSLRIPDDEQASRVETWAIMLRGLGHWGGAFYAAATRSLPEGDYRRPELDSRAWDYLYAWSRDCGEIVCALSELGDSMVVPDLVGWYQRLPGFADNAKIMYRVDGGEVPEEQIIPGVGYHGAPYRVGNGAADQPQSDRWVYPLWAQYLEATNGRFDLKLTIGLAEQAVRAIGQPCCGVWEVRRPGEELPVYASTQILLGQALYYAARILEKAGKYGELAAKYRELAAGVKEWVLDNCVQDGVIVTAPKLPFLDSSVLLAFLWGEDMFDLNDPRDRQLVLSTVQAIDTPDTTPAPFKGLRVGDGHVRYHTDEFGDGVSPEEEGLFNNVTAWVAQVYLSLGMLEEADAVMRGLLKARNGFGGWSEEHTKDGIALGNAGQGYPLAAALRFALLRATFVAARKSASEAVAA